MNEHIDGDDYTYPPHFNVSSAGNPINLDGTLVKAQPWPQTGPEHNAQDIADLRRDLVRALATMQELNRRIAVLEHRLSLLEAAEVAL